MSILARHPDRNPQPHDPVAEALPTIAPERHWYVAGPGGYCAACNLPQRNRRHVARPV